MIETYDAIIFGCGEGGKCMAWHLAKTGLRTIVVEQRYVGGSCPNIACLPSKNIIHSAGIAETVRTAAGYGTHTPGFTVSMAEVQARKRAMVDGLVAMHHRKFRESGAELVMGWGTLIGDRTVSVALADGGTRTLRADKLFLDLGAFATMPNLPGLAEADAMTHVELLDADTLPEHLLILGGGYIALEFAQAMRRLGAAVTVVERAERLLMREDPDIAAAVTDLLLSEGITIVTGADIQRVSGHNGAAVTLHGPGRDITGTHLLVALGKAPNTKDIGLDQAGIAVTPTGYIQVNDRLETTAPNVWALGDCAGTPAFTHMSYEDFRLVRDNLAGASRTTANRQVPNCLFIEPELARIGLNEIEAKRAGIPYRLAKLPITAILRTRTTGEDRGMLKALIGADDRILGFTAFSPRAGELLPVIQLAMQAGLPYQQVEALTVAHPTYAEGFILLFGAVPK